MVRTPSPSPAHPSVDPVGIAEIADRLGVKQSTVHQWRKRGVLPKPDWELGHPVWRWSTIRVWAIRTGRL